MKADTPQRYAPFTRFLHWGMAACYAFMFASALAWHLNGSLKFLIAPHKAVGVLLLLLAAVRFVWALRNLRRRPAGSLKVKLGHLALYALMFAVPASGMARQMQASFGNVHGPLAFAFFVLIAGHVAMSVIHQAKGEAILRRIA